MIYLLLWAESLALCVLAVLWAFTFWQQTRFRKLGVTALVLTLLFTAVFTGAQLTVSIVLASVRVKPNYLFYSLALVAALVAITVTVLRRGFRKEDERRRITAWPQAHLGIAALAALALYLTTMMTIDTTMQLKLSNVRLEAGALAMSEAPPRPPERENAAYVYLRAFERLEASKRSDVYKDLSKATHFKGFDTVNDPQDPLMRGYLAEVNPVLELLRRAAAMPSCVFERGYATPSFELPLPELSKMRECARLLAAEARFRAATGDVKGALQNVRAIQGLAEHMSCEPILISGLVSIGCANIGVDTLEKVLRTTNPSAADLEALGNDDSINFRRVLGRSLRGEHAFGLSGFAMLGESNGMQMLAMMEGGQRGSLSWIADMSLPYWRIYLMPADLRAYNAAMSELKRSEQDTYKANQEKVARLDSRLNEREGILTTMLMPAIGHSVKGFLSAEARQRMAAVARAVARYRAKNNAFPKDLEALVPEFLSEVPTDPFDDKPLRMKSHPEGVTLYSVGTDAVDQGGLPPTKNVQDSNDIVLRIGKVEEPAATSLPDGKPAPKLPAPPKTGF